MDLVLSPAHHGFAMPCAGTAFDADTAAWIPCPHPAHTEPTTDLERLAQENADLRAGLARALNIAAIFQRMAGA